MDEIARIAGVSKATVSRVVNQKAEGVSDATRKRIQELLDRMGYQASPVFSAGTNAKTKTIGLIVPDITTPFFPRNRQLKRVFGFAGQYKFFFRERGWIHLGIYCQKSRWDYFGVSAEPIQQRLRLV